MNGLQTNQKISAAHLARKAIIYIRQSSLKQVKDNMESQRLQYALTESAKHFGFEQIEVIDCDLGISASTSTIKREGFKQLLADVALGDVGLILSREVSRLSRNDKDWCHLMEICKLFNTLIGDAETIYDLNMLDDQLILGIKGTLSVVELSVLKMRLLQGQEEKARRGEMVRILAPGYICADGTKIVKDPNLRVQEVMQLVFKTFSRLGSIRQTYRWFHEENIELPVNKPVNGRHQLVWQLPVQCFISSVLHNPLYAGAYVYGRYPRKVKIEDGQAIKRQSRITSFEEAKVFIKDHHEAYIDWETYEKNQRIMKNNGGNFKGDEDTMKAVRDGHSLLNGLLRCGHCGKKLTVRYWGKKGTAARYLCPGDFDSGGKYCIGFGGATVDKYFSSIVLDAITPLSMEASLLAIEQMTHQQNDSRNALTRQLQQAEYEANRAFTQYDEVDATNRLVAEVLEARWNQTLKSVEQCKARLVELDAQSEPINAIQRAKILELGSNFSSVWQAPACPMILKKKIVRELINEIIVSLDEESQQLNFIIHWHGGSHTNFEMQKPLSGAIAHKTALEDIEVIRKMAIRYPDDAIARVLGKLNRKTGKGLRWTQSRVAYARKKYQINAPNLATLDPNILTLGQAVKYSGVSDTTLMRLIEANILAAKQLVPYAPLEINRLDLDAEPVISILNQLKKTGKLNLKRDTLKNETPESI